MVLICLISGFVVGGIWMLRGVPFVGKKNRYSIGIYISESPLKFVSNNYNINNPVLTAANINDVEADFVADPFMVKENSIWYMFFEVMNAHTKQGDIGCAISNDGLNWVYKQIVLDEPFHLSYPYVFKWKGDYYMIPESCEVNSVRLYKAVDFPTRWSLIGTLLYGNYVDSSIFRYDDIWWLFTETNPTGNDTLSIYYANDLIGPWTEHPMSPVVEGDANIARPGGRVLIVDGRIIRYTQDDDPTYGNQVRAFEIDLLTTRNYEEHEIEESPILKASGNGWNAKGMHHIDPHQIYENKWITCVDGYRKVLSFKFK